MEDALFHFLDVNVHSSDNIYIVHETYAGESGTS